MKKDRKLKRKKSKIIKLKKLLKTKRFKEKLKKEKKFKERTPLDLINKVDKEYNLDTFSIFYDLKKYNPNKRIKKLNYLQDVYVGLLNNISYDSKDKESLIMRRNIKDVISYINKRLVFEKENKIKEVKEDTPALEEKPNPKKKYNDYPEGIIDNFRNRIRNNQITTELIDDSYDIISLIHGKSDDIIIINSILDIIKNKKYELNKTSNEYLLLKQVRDIFKKYKKSIDYDKSDEFIDEADVQRYNIILSLLYNEKDYYIVKSLLENLESFVNVRIDNKHIICYILDIYLKYLEELLNKNFKFSNKINVDYIYEIYLLYIKNKRLSLKRSDIEYIYYKIDMFADKITDDVDKKKVVILNKEYNTILIKKESKKESVIKKLGNLIPYAEEPKELKYRKFKDYELETQIKYFLNNKCFSNSYNDLTEKENIMITNSFVCYGYNKDSKVLKVSIPDISLLIDEDTPLDSYLYNKAIKRERIDERILDKLIYKDDEEMPSITFKMLLDKNNNPTNLYIYKSKIVPKRYYNTKTYSDLKEDFGSLIEDQVDNILNSSYLKFVKDNNLPFIYSGNEELEQFDYDTFVNVSSMSQIFSDSEYNKIYKVLTSTTRSFHYSNKEFNSNNYSMNLLRPNYMTLLNIRIIKKLVLNNFNATDFINEEIKELVDNLNTSLKYKDPNKLFKKLVKNKNK